MFMNDISIIVRHMRVFAERRMAEEGLGFPEQLVIMCLAASGTSNQERIASFLDIDKGAVAKTVAKLEAKRLVDGRTNEDNRREKILSLSPAGRQAIERMQDALASWEDHVFEGVGREDRLAAERAIARMAQNSHAMIRNED